MSARNFVGALVRPAALTIALALTQSIFACSSFNCLGNDKASCEELEPLTCAQACCGNRGLCLPSEFSTCTWFDGEPCASGLECLSGCCDGVCTPRCVSAPGAGCCKVDELCVNGCVPPPPPPIGGECADLDPAAPPAPGDVGDCCDTRWPVDGGPCQSGLTCFNGWCTSFGCDAGAPCQDGVVDGDDRSPFPTDTEFTCLLPASGAPSYCAPLGSDLRVCAVASGEACTPGEVCTFAIDPASSDGSLAGVCQTSFSGAAPTGAPCHAPSERPCGVDADCGVTGSSIVETCRDSRCALAHPESRYQCAAGAGVFELLSCGAASSCDGPGGFFDGGCFAGYFSDAGFCTEACSAGGPPCPAGLVCADLFGPGAGVCVGQECGRSEAPIDPSDPLFGAGLAGATIPCNTSADCDNGGPGGARCLGGACEHTERIGTCSAGMYCSTVLSTDVFPQGVPDLDSLGRTENDTLTMYCAPAVPLAPLAPGEPCVDSADCATGLCDADVLDDGPGEGRCTHPCANDASCPAPLRCVDVDLPLGPGVATHLPICRDAATLGLQTCTADADCPALLGCAPWSSRASVGVCTAQVGVVEGTTDNLAAGASCSTALMRCEPGADLLVDSTAADAAAGVCLGDDRLVSGSNNCRSRRCWDVDDPDGGPASATTVNGACSSVCTTNADCDSWSRCREVRLGDNATFDTNDDAFLGMCVTYRPATTAPCAASLCGLGRECDDGDLAGELGTGSCYSPSAAVGDPCNTRIDCPYGGRCLTSVYAPDGYCTVDGCGFDPLTGLGDGADCPGGSALTVCWAEHGVAAACLARCESADPVCAASTSCVLLGTSTTACYP